MKQRKDRTWYEAMGVEDPSHEPHLTEERLEEIFSKMRKTTRHGNWIQKGVGGPITCRTCPMEHSWSVPSDRILMGTDKKGLPILQKVI